MESIAYSITVITDDVKINVLLLEGHTAKVFRVKWCPLREGILVSGSDDWSVGSVVTILSVSIYLLHSYL